MIASIILFLSQVGYGDITPKTWFGEKIILLHLSVFFSLPQLLCPGKMVGSCCAIVGVLIISLPIPIIVNTFNKLYEKAKIKNQILKKKKLAGWTDFKRTGFQKVSPSTSSCAMLACKQRRLHGKTVADRLRPEKKNSLRSDRPEK